MIRAYYLRSLRLVSRPSGNAAGLRNTLGFEAQPARRALTSMSQAGLRLPIFISRATPKINCRPRISNPTNQSYRPPLRTSKRSFHKTSRLRDAKPDPKNTASPQEPQSLSARLRKLSREYGWAAVGVYLGLSVLDFPFCFLLVRVVGTDRIGEESDSLAGEPVLTHSIKAN